MRTTKFFLAAVAALSLTACNNSDEATTDLVADTPITLQAGVNNLAVSRAGYATGSLTEGMIGFSMTTTGHTDNTRFNATNMKWEYNNGWTSENQVYWYDTNTTVDYWAYMPYNESVQNGSLSFTVDAAQNQEEKEKASDFLYAKGQTKGEDSTNGIALDFDHKMSKLTVTLTNGTELSGTPTYSGVKLGGTKLAATIALSNGTVTVSESATATDISMFKNSDGTYECIFVPQAAAFTISVTVDNKTYTYTAASTTFASGKAYTLALKVGREKITLGGFTVKEWGTTGEGHELTAGTADEATSAAED